MADLKFSPRKAKAHLKEDSTEENSKYNRRFNNLGLFVSGTGQNFT